MQKRKIPFSGGGNGISRGSLTDSTLGEPGWKGVEKLSLWINDYAAKINGRGKTIEFLWLVHRSERWFDLCDPNRYAKEENGQVGAAINKNDGKVHLLRTEEGHKKFLSENKGYHYEYWVLEPIGDDGKKTVAEKLKEHPLYREYAAVFPNKPVGAS